MYSILRIYVPSTLNVATQHTDVLTVTLDLTSDISKQSTLHDQIHYSLRIKSSTLNVAAHHIDVLTVTLDLTSDISNQPILHDQIHYSLRIKSSCK